MCFCLSCVPSVIACSREKPHPAKGNRGEDACFTLDGQTYFVAGIADGVGGWSQQGVDSGEYSRELMENARKCAIDQELRQDPKLLMDKAHVDMSDKKLGSCTACIVVIEDNKLRYANLGDSGLLGYRPRTRETFARSEEQQHSFNCPFQLGHDSGDSADDARGEIVDVHEHDIIVLGTDGFFDNLHDKDIIRLLGTFMTKNLRQSNWPRGNHTAEAKATTAVASSSTMTPQEQARTLHTATELAASLSTATASTDLSSSSSSSLSDYLLSAESLQKLADHLVEEAHKVAKDPNALRTPFNEHALKKGKRFRGGKMDDIVRHTTRKHEQRGGTIEGDAHWASVARCVPLC